MQYFIVHAEPCEHAIRHAAQASLKLGRTLAAVETSTLQRAAEQMERYRSELAELRGKIPVDGPASPEMATTGKTLTQIISPV
jgi:hypothetical protein